MIIDTDYLVMITCIWHTYLFQCLFRLSSDYESIVLTRTNDYLWTKHKINNYIIIF